MPLKIAQMKFVTNKVMLPFFLLFFSLTFVNAQEVIKDSVVATKKDLVSSISTK
jgi:peptidyl-prolyl cis-trans isomerase SurA